MRPNLAFGSAAALLLLAVAAAPSSAQDYRQSIGWNVGVTMIGSLNEGPASGNVALEPELTWVAGIQYDYWLWTGHLGLRGGVAASRPQIDWSNGSRNLYAWTVDASLLLRPIRPTEFQVVSPYLAVGVGGTRYRLGDGPPTSFEAANAVFQGREEFQLTGVGGVGLDYVTPWRFDGAPLIFRIEAADHYALDSPFRPAEGEGDFDPIHAFRVTLGLHTGVGTIVRRR